jgi:hypothetical protein
MDRRTAFTVRGQKITVVTIKVENRTIYALEDSDMLYEIIIVDGNMFVANKVPVPLFAGQGIPSTPENLVTLPIAESNLSYNPTKEELVKTSDPVGTNRFDDAYSVITKKYNISGVIITVMTVIVAVVHHSVAAIGFKAGLEQKAFLFKYTYFFIQNESETIYLDKSFRIGIGKAVATKNEFFKVKTATVNGRSLQVPAQPTPLLTELAGVISMIQPNSRYAVPEKAVMFWAKCVSLNTCETYKRNNISCENKKFTAPMRQDEPKKNLIELEVYLRSNPNLKALKF